MTFDLIESTKMRARVAVAASILLVTSAMFAAPRTITGKQSAPQANAGKQAVVEIKGMSCPFCAYGAKKRLMKLPGAKKVDVTLGQDKAIVDFTPDSKVTDDQIRKAVHDAGFTPGKIEWRNADQQRGQPGSGSH